MLRKPIDHRFLRLFAALTLAFAGIATPACASGEAQSTATAGKGGSDPSTVAEVGGKPITMADVEEAMAGQLADLDRQRRKIIEGGLDGVIEQRLLETEAEARGINVTQLLKAEGEGGEVTDEAISEFYEGNKSRMSGRSLEEMTPQIRNYLANRQRTESRQKLVTALRAKYETKIFLEPERADVQVGDSPSKGPADAPVTIVEFSDFQCPYCARVLPSIEETLATYGDQVRFVFRQFPLNIHANAQKAAEASLCAREQDKFWELHDAMFADQRGLADDGLKSKAAALGLDTEKFNACLDSDKYAAQVSADMQHGRSVGVGGTPALFINGRFLNGAVPFSTISKVIDDELSRKGITPKSAG